VVAGLVDDEYRLVVVEVFGHVAAQVVADSVSVPLGAVQKVLHPVRGRLSGPLGDGPAVLAGQIREQAEHQPPYRAAGFNPGELARDPVHQALECLLPAGRVYPVTRGHRMIICLHTPMINGGRTCRRTRSSQ
jgi:hypothetical protein